MKRTLITLISALTLLVFIGQTYAQVPQAFNYQAVARDVSGNILVSQTIGLKLTIHQTSSSGTIVYSETHSPTTNQFGLFTVALGTGTIVSGTFNTVDWSTGNYWLQVQLDPAGGTTYADLGATQLLSVPFAMYADNAGTSGATGPTGPTGTNGATGAAGTNGTNGATGAAGTVGATGATGAAGAGTVSGTLNYVAKFTSTTAVGNSLIFDNGTNVGIGTTTPNSPLQVVTSGYNIADFKTTGASDARISFSTSAGYKGTVGWTPYNSTMALISTGADDISFGVSNLATEIMRLKASNGYVGIGTTNPSYKLDVNGNVRIGSDASTMTYLYLDKMDETDDSWIGFRSAGLSTWIAGEYGGTDDFRLIDWYNGGSANAAFFVRLGGSNNVGIGTITPLASARLHVASQNKYAGYFTTDTASSTGRAIYAEYTNTGSFDAAAVYGKNDAADWYGYGGLFDAKYKAVHAYAHNTTTNPIYGVSGQASSTVAGSAYGVYGYATTVGGTAYAVYASGDMAYTGTITDVSDAKFKKDVTDFSGALDNVLKLRPVSYSMKTDEYPAMGFTDDVEYGFIAQELENVYPDLVKNGVHPGATKEDKMIDYKGINYIGLIPVLVKAIQEQQEQIEVLKAEIKTLKNQ